ncbi:hypothetical protein BSAE_1843 [Bifidobacterium pullorum subsp. saeculare DSM 6531 = LMG 14934]|uniref:Uncharacterized protein n=1 Tax=Bifidobacterium pullorum subsp. saeculare DSM 6531 = LMG 14934 TaxID=1437611 RepID=A0A087CP51_9BIFI|nr:hypothetical protein BSAE_1843 [Bifidobacterium pullorum subsp. saeculare DSM 6531 = LMG 14934]
MLRTSLQQPITPVDDIDSIHHGIGAHSIIVCLGARSPPLYIRMFPRGGRRQRAPIHYVSLAGRHLSGACQQRAFKVIQQQWGAIAVDEEVAVQPACDRQPRLVGLHGDGNEFPAGRLDRSTPHTHGTP